MIAVAGYLSFTDKNGKDERVAMEASADTADLSYEISAEDDLAEADIFTDTEDNSSEAVSAADGVVEEMCIRDRNEDASSFHVAGCNCSG